MPDCLFCSIVDGTTAAHVVVDDDVCVAFLDRAPLFVGHTLVVPRVHVETLADLPTELIGPFFERVARLSEAVQTGLGAGGAFVANNNRVSQSVAHLHVHVIPRTKGDGLKGFFWPRVRYEHDEHAAATAATLAAAYQALLADSA